MFFIPFIPAIATGLSSIVATTATTSAVATGLAAVGGAGIATAAGVAAISSTATGVGALTATSLVGTAVTAIKAASAAEKLWTASALLSGGYMLGKYIQSREQQDSQEAPTEAEIQAGIEELREYFPEATDEELRELLLMFMALEQ